MARGQSVPARGRLRESGARSARRSGDQPARRVPRRHRIAVTIVAAGATITHVIDIVESGNLAPGNTVQNLANVLRPGVLIWLLLAIRRTESAEGHVEEPALLGPWRDTAVIAAAQATAVVSATFSIGYAVDRPAVGAAVGGSLPWPRPHTRCRAQLSASIDRLCSPRETHTPRVAHVDTHPAAPTCSRRSSSRDSALCAGSPSMPVTGEGAARRSARGRAAPQLRGASSDPTATPGPGVVSG